MYGRIDAVLGMDGALRSIVVAIDGSDHAATALALAIDLAQHYDARLTIVSVAPIEVPMPVGEPGDVMPPPVIPESLLPEARDLVDAAVVRARGAGVRAVEGVYREGSPVGQVLELLSNHPTDLLVLGSHGASAATRLLLGSVSTALVHRAPCPVLVVRRPPAKLSDER